jgi:hypothetical protein
MSPTEGSHEVQNVAERAQEDLTDKVGVRLTKQEKQSNLSWSTWKRRLGMGGSTRPEA